MELVLVVFLVETQFKFKFKGALQMFFFHSLYWSKFKQTLKNMVNNQNERKKIKNNWMSWELIHSKSNERKKTNNNWMS